MTNPVRLTRQEVRAELKQFLIFKWYCPEFLSKEFLNHIMDQLTFENEGIEFRSLAEMTFCFNELIDEAITWQQEEWVKQNPPRSDVRVIEPLPEGEWPF